MILMLQPKSKILAALICGCLVAGTANAATTYFASDFNSYPDSATVVTGALNNLSAYGLPTQFGMIRDDGSGGKALNIYGGEPHNGSNSGAFGNLATRIAAGETVLRMTGFYRTTPAYDNTPWNQTGEIQLQNTVGFFPYNSITVSASTPNWTPFTLDLDLTGLDPAQLGQVQANFYLPGTNPGQLQVDGLIIQTTQAVPEPSVVALGGVALAGLAALTRFRRK